MSLRVFFKMKRALIGICIMMSALRPRGGVFGRGAAATGTCGKVNYLVSSMY
jgi:hypothetical protein